MYRLCQQCHSIKPTSPAPLISPAAKEYLISDPWYSHHRDRHRKGLHYKSALNYTEAPAVSSNLIPSDILAEAPCSNACLPACQTLTAPTQARFLTDLQLTPFTLSAPFQVLFCETLMSGKCHFILFPLADSPLYQLCFSFSQQFKLILFLLISKSEG